jgi:phosphoribosylformimino-5-aminoimidazole carboxamide ribotide isomerase
MGCLPMQIIPVMDLLDGQVVRAVAGERWRYRPLQSRLTPHTEPVAVARAMLSLAPFQALYIADLDAITKGGSERHQAVLADICAEAGRRGVKELWLDAGLAVWVDGLAILARKHRLGVVPIVGAESLAASDSLMTMGYSPNSSAWVLSLDFRSGKFLGPAGLDTCAAVWPSRVIVMELSAVGVGGGPALARLDTLIAGSRSAGRNDIAFFAGGGVRNAGDLDALTAHGAKGALIASALHDGNLDVSALGCFPRHR